MELDGETGLNQSDRGIAWCDDFYDASSPQTNNVSRRRVVAKLRGVPLEAAREMDTCTREEEC